MNPQADKMLAGLKAGINKGQVTVPDATPMKPKVDAPASQDKLKEMDEVFKPMNSKKVRLEVVEGTMPVPKNNNKDPENINSGEQASDERCIKLEMTFKRKKA